MDYLYERISYLRGLADGLDINEKSNEGKLLLNMVDVLEDFADAIGDLSIEQGEIEEYIDYIDEDLADVEDDIYADVEILDDEYYEE